MDTSISPDEARTGRPIHRLLRDERVLQPISEDECWWLIAHEMLGRIAYVEAGMPAVVPVAFIIDEESIAIRSVPGSKLSTVADRAEVAFEVDHHRPASATGWSVVVKGVAREVVTPREIARLDALPRFPMYPLDQSHHWIRITPRSISGRRLTTPVD